MTSRLHRNFVLLMASNVLSPLLSMVLVLAISRLQGVEALGKYSLLMTVFIVSQSCATLGLSIIITREVAQEHDLAGHYFVNACLLTGMLMTLLLLVAVPAVGWGFGELDMRLAMSLTLVTLLPSVIMTYGEAVLLALERAGDYVAVGLGENLVRAALGSVLVFLGHGIVAIALCILGVRLIASALLLAVLARRGVTFRTRLDTTLWRQLLRFVPVVGAIPIVNQVYARSDMFLLSVLGSWKEVGLYSAGLRLVDLARTVSPAYGKALYPILARLHGSYPGEFADLTRRSIRQSVLLVAPLTFVLAGFSSELIAGIYGGKAAGGESSLAVLAWTLIPLGIACTLAQVLFAAGRQAVDLRVNAIATVVSLAANLALIPHFGAVGAATAMLGSMSLYALLQYFWVYREVVDPGAVEYVAKLTAVALVSILVATGLRGAGLVVAGAAGIVTLAGGGLLGGLVTREDLLRLRTSVATRNRWLWGAR